LPKNLILSRTVDIQKIYRCACQVIVAYSNLFYPWIIPHGRDINFEAPALAVLSKPPFRSVGKGSLD
jgi:hypothetical protein